MDEQPASSLTLSADSLEHLRTASTWARFLAILGFIATALIVCASIVTFLFIRSQLAGEPPRDPGVVYGGPGETVKSIVSIMPLFYLILGGVYFFICRKLYRFANYTRQAVDSADNTDLELGVEQLGSFFKTFGILAIVGLVLYLIVTIGALGSVLTQL